MHGDDFRPHFAKPLAKFWKLLQDTLAHGDQLRFPAIRGEFRKNGRVCELFLRIAVERQSTKKGRKYWFHEMFQLL